MKTFSDFLENFMRFFRPQSPIVSLSDDLWLEIFRYMDPKEIAILALTCKRFNNAIITYSNTVWRRALINISQDEAYRLIYRNPEIKISKSEPSKLHLRNLLRQYHSFSRSYPLFNFGVISPNNQNS